MTRGSLRPEDADLWAAVAATVRRSGNEPSPPAHPSRSAADLRSKTSPGGSPSPTPSDFAMQWSQFSDATASVRHRVRGPAAEVAVRARGSSSPSPPFDPRRAGPDLHRAASRPPVERSHERRIRRGRVDIDGVLDLHGMTLDQAGSAVGRFLFSAHARGATCVVIVTGKGRRRSGRAVDGFAAEDGVLRRAFPDWMTAPAIRSAVSGYARAHDRHGGDGAWYVFLRPLPSAQ